MNWMKKNWTEKALDEQEMHGQKCIESASTHIMKQNQFFEKVLFGPSPYYIPIIL
jgi:hypothetical protein